jgi:FemAB family protein
MNIVKTLDLKNQTFWNNLIKEDCIQYNLYSPLHIKYNIEYFIEHSFKDLSFIILDNNQPIMGAILSVDNCSCLNTSLSGFGTPIYYLESSNTNQTILKKSKKQFKEYFFSLVDEYSIKSIQYRDFLFKNQLSFLGKMLLDKKANAIPFFTSIIDLSMSQEKLHKTLRKSYKSLINWGLKNLTIKILNHKNITTKDIELFRNLHINAAKKETRSKKTWEIQYEMITNNEAFIITGSNQDKVITASLYHHNSKYCYYGVSASDRNFFDNPISHAIVWKAILHAKQINCQYFEVGKHLFPTNSPNKTQKEFDINTFKNGFGGKTIVRLDVLWKK